ncbi:MAG: YidC/Oxa1 family membrane protein insertase [bacterium]
MSAIVPNNDIGIAIVLLTIFSKIVILPLSHKSLETQKKMKEIEPHIKNIKEKFKDNQEEQAIRTMNLYKEHGINPFSTILLLFIQLPMFIALYYIFSEKIDLTSSVIFSFNIIPSTVNTMFLGFIEMATSNFYLAVLVGITQFFQTKLSVPDLPKSQGKESSFADDFAQSMNWQVKYFLPVFIVYIASKLNAAVSVFWITSNLFGIAHELYVKQKAKSI